MTEDKLYLTHIAECIERVEEYTTDGRRAFLNDHRTQDAVLRNLQVLAESTQRLSDECRATRTEVDWRGIAGFRNFLVHGYLGVDILRVWDVASNDLPGLKTHITEMLAELQSEPDEHAPT